jgi:hypothetical protein
MSNPLHEIDKLFRDGIEDRSEYPPKELWDNIEAELDKKIAISYKRKYNSLKRKTSALLILLLSIVSYQAAKLYMRKETVQQDKAVLLTNEPDQSAIEIPIITSVQNKDFEKNGKHNNIILEHNKVLPSSQLPKVNTSNGVNRFGKVQPDNDRVQTTIAEETNLNALSLQRENQQKENTFSISSPRTGSGIKDKQVFEYARLNPLLSFAKIADDDSWKKNLAAGLKPVISGPLPTGEVTAKKSNRPDPVSSRFSFSVYVSPGLAWATLTDDLYQQQGRRGIRSGGSNNGSGRGDNRNEIKQGESENLAYSAGIKLGYNLNKKISLQTGLNYLVNSTSVRPKLVFAAKDINGGVSYRINCSSGYSFLKPGGSPNVSMGDSTIVSDTRSAVSYVGIPVIVEYNLFTAGKFSLAASAGGQVNILEKAKTTSVFGKGTVNESNVSSKTQGLKKTYFSALASIIAELHVKKNLALTLAPAGQIGLSYMNKETSVKTRPNYLGLAAGLKLRF